MDANQHELIGAELKIAREALRAARLLLDSGLIRDATSRAYYAVFHAAKALLASRRIHAESHSGLKALFGLHFVDKGLVERPLGQVLSELMDLREASDYDAWTPLDEGAAARCVAQAEQFLTAIESVLRTGGIET